eukprot:6939182-Prymnesium_polylepis.1
MAAAAKKAAEERKKVREAQAILLAKAAAEADKAALAAEEDAPEHEIDSIGDVKKGPLGLVYLITWKTQGEGVEAEQTWEPEANLHP